MYVCVYELRIKLSSIIQIRFPCRKRHAYLCCKAGISRPRRQANHRDSEVLGALGVGDRRFESKACPGITCQSVCFALRLAEYLLSLLGRSSRDIRWPKRPSLRSPMQRATSCSRRDSVLRTALD